MDQASQPPRAVAPISTLREVTKLPSTTYFDDRRTDDAAEIVIEWSTVVQPPSVGSKLNRINLSFGSGTREEYLDLEISTS